MALNDAVLLGRPPVEASPTFAMFALSAGVHADWAARGLPIDQAPTTLHFGRTFVALDPDRHRSQVFAPPVPAAPGA